MLGKLSVLLVLCQVIAFTFGGVLPTTPTDEEESCSGMYVNCTTNEECCIPMRCLDFGNGPKCSTGTDSPYIPQVRNAEQLPRDFDPKDLGCSLFGDICEEELDCCAPFVCSADAICKEPEADPYGGGFPGFTGK